MSWVKAPSILFFFKCKAFKAFGCRIRDLMIKQIQFHSQSKINFFLAEMVPKQFSSF